MSDLPNPPPPPANPNRTPGDANGFNWRLLVLLGVAALILGVAFFGPTMNKAVETISYSQFRQSWDQGRIITDDTKRPLKVITSDSAYDATISGWQARELLKPTDPQKKRSDFRVLVNLDLQGEQLRDMLGDEGLIPG